MYVYIHDRVWAVANDWHRERLKAIITQVEQGNIFTLSLLFRPRLPYCWIKRLRIEYRLMAKVVPLRGQTVLCALHLLYRGGSEYLNFLADPDSWSHRHLQIDEVALAEWLDQRLQAEQTPPPPLLSLSTTQRDWLAQPTLLQSESCMVLESRNWVEQWRSDSFTPEQQTTLWSLVCHLLTLQDNGYSTDILDSRYPKVRYCQDLASGQCLLYAEVWPQDASQRQFFFLIKAFPKWPDLTEQIRVGRELQLFGTGVETPLLQQDEIHSDALARLALRSYPNYLVPDDDLWLKLEQEDEINLSLSGEEEELLQKLHFPAFINGRAGSGKSTMLHFAFAYYCDLYLQNSQVDPSFRPLFLTYSRRLRDRAYEVVSRILTSHAHYEKRDFTADQLNPLKECFQSFQQFLLSLLPAAAAERFSDDRYLSFNHFKHWFRRAFPNFDYPAETCWYAIRTYIKGFHFTDNVTSDPQLAQQGSLSPQEYSTEVPHDQQTLSLSVFTEIYNSIWLPYTRWQQDEQRWDDQDLARQILATTLCKPNLQDRPYGAIFCDEAQDFTRLELQIILRLSPWANYQLYPPIHSLPFAFAGDPLQTLNPTGFSWASFRASFYEQILTPLDPGGQLRLQGDRVKLWDLQHNYRSTPPLVQLANAINLWRSQLFRLSNLTPQLPWTSPGQTHSPQKGVLGRNLTRFGLQESLYLPGVLLILPCDEGGEIDFLQACVQHQPDLRSVFPTLATVPPTCPSNFLTASQVKGLESKHVILFGFGEYYAQHFPQLDLEKATEAGADPALRFALEYFFNKLYVAVSRSQRMLGILETERGDTQFWQKLTAAQVRYWLQQLPTEEARAQWQPWVQADLREFYSNQFQEARSNAPSLACNLLSQALEEHNLQLFRSAKENYRMAEWEAEARFCEAWELRLQGQLRQAGEQFLAISGWQDPQLDPIGEAWGCFWQAQDWPRLAQWCDRYSDRAEAQWQAIVAFMAADAKLPQLKQVTVVLSQACFAESDLKVQRRDSVWKQVFQQFGAVIEGVLGVGATDMAAVLRSPSWNPADSPAAALIPAVSPEIAALVPQWYRLLKQWATLGIAPDRTLTQAGHCAYVQRDYTGAIADWDAAQATPPHRYALARAEVDPLPEKVRWLDQAQAYGVIVALWRARESDYLPSLMPWVRIALAHTDQHLDLFKLEMKDREWLTAVQHFCDRRRQKDSDFTPQLHWSLVQKLAQDQQYTNREIRRQVYHFVHNPSPTQEKLINAYLWESQWVDLHRRDTDRKSPKERYLFQQRDRLRQALMCSLMRADPLDGGAGYQAFCEQIHREMVQQVGRDRGLKEFKPWDQWEERERELEIEYLFAVASRILSEFMAAVRSLPGWEPSLDHLKQVRRAFARIGEFKPALEFYEHFRGEPQDDLRQWAYQSWYETKQKQAQYAENWGEADDAERIRKDLSRSTPWPAPVLSVPESQLESQPDVTSESQPGLKLESQLGSKPESPPLLSPPTPQPLGAANVLSVLSHREEIDRYLSQCSPAELQQVLHYLRFLAYERDRSSSVLEN